MGLLDLGTDNIARDDTGQIIPNAKRSIFAAHSVGLVRIYADPEFEQTQENPMEADVNGAFPPCYIPVGTYRIVDEDHRGAEYVVRGNETVSSDADAEPDIEFTSLTNLLGGQSSYSEIAVGTILTTRAGGYRYKVLESGSTQEHFTTSGGLKIEVQDANGIYFDASFGVVGDGTTDDIAAIKALRDAAEARNKAISFRPLTYRYSEPLAFSGIDVDFNGAELVYDGPTGEFALSLTSLSGAGVTQTRGNKFTNFTLVQEDFAEYDTHTTSTTFDPGNIPADSNLTAATPGGVETTLSVPGARAGGFCRASFSELAEGVEVTAWVSANDQVTVNFSNYTASGVDMPAGTLDVTVVNNAYHGLSIGGSLGKLEGVKLRGFTGVSFGVGSGRCQISGVDFSAQHEAYYWDASVNINPAAGWGMICQPRNNANEFSLSLFPANFYGDNRSCCINQVVLSGVANKLRRLSLECNSTETAVVLTDAANTIYGLGICYLEDNPNYPDSPAPKVVAKRHSSGSSMDFRMYGDRAIQDLGMGNSIRRVATFYLNPQIESPVSGSRNLVTNGDFGNGLNSWSNWTNGTPTTTFPGPGKLTGQRVRIDVVNGRPNLQQELHQVGDYEMSGLQGHTLTFGAWVKTDLPDIVVRAAGVAGLFHPADGEWHFLTTTIRPADASSISLSVIKSSSNTVNGFIEISGVVGAIGTTVPAMPEKSQLTGKKTYNPPSVAAGGWGASTTIDVPGAVLGDIVIGVSHSRWGALTWPAAVVSESDTVTVAPFNPTGATIDLGSGTLRCVVQKT